MADHIGLGRPEPELVFLLGAPKCGTTTLAELLDRRPGVLLSSPKETFHFSDDATAAAGLEHYLQRYFRGPERHRARYLLDATAGYLGGPGVPDRVAASLDRPPALFVAIVRDPVDRLWSHWLHQRRIALEDRGFVDAIEADLDHPAEEQRYVAHSRYAANLDRWRARFPDTPVVVETLDRLRFDPRGVVVRLADRLGVEPPAADDDCRLVANQAAVPRSGALMRGLNEPSNLKRLVRPLVSPRMRRVVMHRARAALLRTPRPGELPSQPADAHARFAPHFAEDVRSLAGDHGVDVAGWPTVAALGRI